MNSDAWIATLVDGTEVRVEWRTTSEQESLPESERDEWQVFVDGDPLARGYTRAPTLGEKFSHAVREVLRANVREFIPAVVEWRRAGEAGRKEMRVAMEGCEVVIGPFVDALTKKYGDPFAETIPAPMHWSVAAALGMIRIALRKVAQ